MLSLPPVSLFRSLFNQTKQTTKTTKTKTRPSNPFPDFTRPESLSIIRVPVPFLASIVARSFPHIHTRCGAAGGFDPHPTFNNPFRFLSPPATAGLFFSRFCLFNNPQRL